MSWPFWSYRATNDENCESIEPLLSLYADGMASAEEARRVEAHLPDCADCRESLAWMQATHRALAGRPVAVPPANLHSRIAQAIAASSAAPVSLRPARSFTLRPAYAAAASLTVLGVLSYSVLHTFSGVAVKPMPKHSSQVASVPAVKAPAPVSTHSGRVKPARPLIAQMPATPERVKPAVKHLQTLSKPAPVIRIAPQEQVADAVPTPALHPVSAHVKSGGSALIPHDKVASQKITPSVTHQPIVPAKSAPLKSAEGPLVAKVTKEPVQVPVEILKPTLTVEPPPVTVASVPAAKSGDFLGAVRAHIETMKTVSYAATRFTARQSTRGATNAMHALDHDQVAVQGLVYTPTGPQ